MSFSDFPAPPFPACSYDFMRGFYIFWLFSFSISPFNFQNLVTHGGRFFILQPVRIVAHFFFQRVRAIKRGAPRTRCLESDDNRIQFPLWVTKTEKCWPCISAPWIKISIPKEARKDGNLPRTAWVFGGDLSEAQNATE